MSELKSHPVSPPETATEPQAPLLAWRGAGVVLLGEHRDGHWVVARGWLRTDAMTDVRRWTFADPARFARQMHRLVLDAIGDPGPAKAFAAAALAWADDCLERPLT